METGEQGEKLEEVSISQPPMDLRWSALTAQYPSPILGGLLT